jgi:hypothetical protein
VSQREKWNKWKKWEQVEEVDEVEKWKMVEKSDWVRVFPR